MTTQAKKRTSKPFPARRKSRFVLDLPFPPSVNNYYGKTRNGQVFIKTPGQEFRRFVVECLREIPHMKATLDDGERLQLFIEAHMPDRRKRDIDNISKALLDSLTHAKVYTDDSQVDDLRIVRHPASPDHKGYVRVHVAIL